MRLILAAAALMALPFAAHAQMIGPPAPDDTQLPGIAVTHAASSNEADIAHQLKDARDTIRRGRKNGELTRHEAKQLKREAGYLDELSARYGKDGMSDPERRELELRTSVLQNDANLQRATQAPPRN